MLNNILLLFAPLFLFVEIWGLFNRNSIYGKLTLEKIDSVNPNLLLAFYSLRVFYWVWMIFGLFSWAWIHVLSLMLIGFSKNFILMTGRNLWINLYDLFNCFASSIILVVILIQAISRLL